ncbi:MAG: DEAD/DEAH box helicase [Candidatus Methanofastidiosa archaeon]|nr:DEAD/DEAH box helicase [Candidatus Methanofastidiosa archaeon]
MLILRRIKGKELSVEVNLVRGAKKLNRVVPTRLYMDFAEENGRLRISKFRSEDEMLQPKVAHDMIKNNIVYISKDDETLKIKGKLISFLKRLDAEVYMIDLCRFCAIDGFLTGTTSRSLNFRGEKVCFTCAKKEVEREMKFRNIQFSDKILDILKRIRDVDKVLELFDPRTDVTRDPNLTLLDRIPADEGSKGRPISLYELSEPLKHYLSRAKVKNFLPVQYMSIESGLLNGKNLLVSSATASGKTLIAEMAGLSALEKGMKFIYLTPLVALANQKYEDFKRRMAGRYSVSIRVGMSRIKTKEDLVVIDSDISADIIVGTYEGLDFLLRSGVDMGRIGCVAIDEIHMLSDPERGYRLSGLITRLRTLYPGAQIIGLSATIGNPEELAKDLNMEAIVYDRRPIPLERHIIFRDDSRKREIIRKIVISEWNTVSGTGFHGQSMIFTNSRLKCSQISQFLFSKGISSAAYHSGLSYSERKKIEKSYWKQELQCVVTTAALSAGVDFPSSAVIMESMFMGSEKLSVGEFHQMLGRAGRPGYHEKGKVFVLVDPLKKIRKETEDKMAFDLLEGKVEDVDVLLDEDQELEELLACYATGRRGIEEYNKNSLWPLPLKNSDKLSENGFLRDGAITPLGRAVANSFLSISDSIKMVRRLDKDPLETAIIVMPFDNVYLSGSLQSMMDTNSVRLFSGEVLEKMENADAVSRLPLSAREIVLGIFMEFFSCECGTPFCEHPPQKISRMVLELRKSGLSPKGIFKHFSKEYDLLLYAGDIFSYLDQVVHKLEAIERLALAKGKHRTATQARAYIKRIEG